MTTQLTRLRYAVAMLTKALANKENNGGGSVGGGGSGSSSAVTAAAVGRNRGKSHDA